MINCSTALLGLINGLLDPLEAQLCERRVSIQWRIVGS